MNGFPNETLLTKWSFWLITFLQVSLSASWRLSRWAAGRAGLWPIQWLWRLRCAVQFCLCECLQLSRLKVFLHFTVGSEDDKLGVIDTRLRSIVPDPILRCVSCHSSMVKSNCCLITQGIRKIRNRLETILLPIAIMNASDFDKLLNIPT